MSAPRPDHIEKRHIVIYGYTRKELSAVIRHFESQLPEYVRISIDNSSLVTRITLTGVDSGLELLRFRMNKYHRALQDLFSEEIVSSDGQDIPAVLGTLLRERELTVSSAESCTGGNIAHKITLMPGSSAYYMGSVVSYSNDIKAGVLGVSRNAIAKYGAVSRQVAEAMAVGVSRLTRSYCAIATTGIAGPDGGTRYKPVGTVWIAVKFNNRIVSECRKFEGNRLAVIESATNHAMVMLIKLLRNTYVMQEDINDE